MHDFALEWVRPPARCAPPRLTASLLQGTVRVHTVGVRTDVAYKTLFISTATTVRDLLRALITKFRLQHKDPNLYYISMVVRIKAEGTRFAVVPATVVATR